MTAFIVLFGTKSVRTTVRSGTFDCPVCRSRQRYEHVATRRWFTLFFIPVVPLDRLGTQVECGGCGSVMGPRVLDTRPRT